MAATLGPAPSVLMMRRRTFMGTVAAAFLPTAVARAQGAGFIPLGPGFTPLQQAVSVEGGRIRVSVGDLVADPVTGLLDLAVRFGRPPPSPVSADEQGETAELLRQRQRRPGIAGNHGDIYDNRDRGHSRMETGRYPGMAATRYANDAEAAGLDRSLNTRLRFGAPTIGNASLAVTAGPLWRSLPRLAMTTRGAMTGIARLYEANHLYVYPAHADVGGRHGDLLPGNVSYFIVSEGSSRSDQPFLAALARIFAAYRPDVKARLVQEGLLAATSQMILRRGMQHAGDPEAYMSGIAHPSAFDPAGIRVRAMIRLANNMTNDTIPPMVRLRMVEEEALGERNDLFADGKDEVLYDTPGAIARTAQGSAGVRHYVIDAEATADPNGRPLRFHWRVLRGEPARVSIVPLDARAARVRVEVRSPESALAEIDRRLDVGVFADNGRQLSAPGFLTVAFPVGQRRSLRADGAPLQIDYRPPEGAYADPVVEPRRGWQDEYRYGPDGRLLGWERRIGDALRFHEADGRTIAPTGQRVLPRYRIVQENGMPTVIPDQS